MAVAENCPSNQIFFTANQSVEQEENRTKTLVILGLDPDMHFQYSVWWNGSSSNSTCGICWSREVTLRKSSGCDWIVKSNQLLFSWNTFLLERTSDRHMFKENIQTRVFGKPSLKSEQMELVTTRQNTWHYLLPIIIIIFFFKWQLEFWKS